MVGALTFPPRQLSGILLLSVCLIGCPQERDHSEIINVHEDDVEMNAAMQQARDTLPEFVQRFHEPEAGDSDFALKVRVEDEYGVEHFWTTDLEERAGGWTGVVANDPKTVRSVEIGETIAFEESEVSDWAYDHEGVRQGSFTLHVLLDRMPKEQAEYYREMVGWGGR